MLPTVAASDATYVAMHWRAHADRMADLADYPDGVVPTVRRELAVRVEAAVAAGVRRTSRLSCQIVITSDLDGLSVKLPPGSRDMSEV